MAMKTTYERTNEKELFWTYLGLGLLIFLTFAGISLLLYNPSFI